MWPHGLSSPWNSPGQNTGVGSCCLLQGIFPTQGLNPGLLHCRWILYQMSHTREAQEFWSGYYLFSRGSSQPRNLTGVSCIAGRVFINETWRKPFIHLFQWNSSNNYHCCCNVSEALPSRDSNEPKPHGAPYFFKLLLIYISKYSTLFAENLLCLTHGASLLTQMVKNLPATQDTWV